MTLVFFPNVEETDVQQEETYLDSETLKGRSPSVSPASLQNSRLFGGHLGCVFCLGSGGQENCPKENVIAWRRFLLPVSIHTLTPSQDAKGNMQCGCQENS